MPYQRSEIGLHVLLCGSILRKEVIKYTFTFGVCTFYNVQMFWSFSHIVPRALAKAGDIKTHSSVCPSLCLSLCLSVTKTLTWLISSEVLMIEHWNLACMIFVTSPFKWHHAMALTFTLDLFQGQICCRAGDHNSPNLLLTLVL